jgi:DNA-binding response OmpR family regulator
MKLMLVSESPQLRPLLEKLFPSKNADVIHYENPIKAMDNLEEIEPEIVVFAATDFPRHWKPFVIYLRNTFTRNEAVFILLVNNTFDEEEARKADYLDVNSVIEQDPDPL